MRCATAKIMTIMLSAVKRAEEDGRTKMGGGALDLLRHACVKFKTGSQSPERGRTPVFNDCRTCAHLRKLIALEISVPN
jgi:hypothetical protein